ncbi:putative Leucine Rich Repeat protein [Paratrimastix pyriformis]|uniref:Leucine Rich Repeat protein n=1 Tax=Paratrimastix pyriformis TaxID=342808 RepID=A0ABQ8U987_9EUKA|nr:putative Leucine Rich Repeat protein [Paratrimastix pyriformis]
MSPWTLLSLFLLAGVAMAADEDEIDALKDLYKNTAGANWTVNTNWTIGDPCKNHWYGVYCDSGSRVTALLLSNNGLAGKLVAIDTSLDQLRTLDLSNNRLTGDFSKLAPYLCSLPQLSVLNLGGNGFTGTLTNCFVKASVDFFYMRDNHLSGSLRDILATPSLVELDLSGNKFHTQLPSSFDDLVNIVKLDLSNNQLYGYLSSELGDLATLKLLNLSHNNFTGTIPSALAALDFTADFSGNTWECPIPSGLSVNCTHCRAGYTVVNGLCKECPAGFSGNGHSECVMCPANTFSPVAGSAFCSQCPRGAFSFEGSADCVGTFLLVQFVLIVLVLVLVVLSLILYCVLRCWLKRHNKAPANDGATAYLHPEFS